MSTNFTSAERLFAQMERTGLKIQFDCGEDIVRFVTIVHHQYLSRFWRHAYGWADDWNIGCGIGINPANGKLCWEDRLMPGAPRCRWNDVSHLFGVEAQILPEIDDLV